MKRTLLVFCLSCLFIIPGFLSAQAENETGLTKMGLSADVLDGSVRDKGGESTLQEISDGSGYDFVATDWFGAEDAGAVAITGDIDDPPQLTCPDDDSVHAGNIFTSTDFSVTDPDGNTAVVSFLDISPSATNDAAVIENHVEWVTTCGEHGDYTIRLVATDPSGLEDTCEFTVNVYNQAPQLTCPDDDSVHASYTLVSTDFSVADLDGDSVTVTFLDINPAAMVSPTIVDTHVEWRTFLAEDGDYVIRLVATDSCGLEDTCGFTVTVYNRLPELTCPNDDSVHAGETFVSSDFFAFDPDGDFISVGLLDINPAPTDYPSIVGSHVVWVTTCDEEGDYVIRLVVSEVCIPADTCEFTVTVYNQPPDLTCPDDDSVNAGDLFVSTDYFVSDPDDSSLVTVEIDSIFPTPTNPPTLVDNHVEWLTTCDDLVNGPVFTITLVATDPCGAEDTCDFTVTVYKLPPQITCPDDDSVHAGDYFTSTDFSVSDPKAEPVTVALCGVDPAPVNQPIKVGTHVEWQTECADAGNVFTICLEATDSCGAKDTCYFQVTVYNQPPQLTCPDDDSVHAGDTFTSTDFSVTDPDGDTALVTFLDITPPATNNPTIVGNHVEWVTTSAEDGDYVIRLVATDSCGAEDTCEFNVCSQPPPDFTILAAPDTQYVTPGQSVGYRVKLTSLFGYDETCTLFVSGLPSPPDSGVFDQPTLIPTDSTTLNVYATTDTDTGWYTLTISAQGPSTKLGVLLHSTQVMLYVEKATDVGDWTDNPNSPKSFALLQNQPNPFNPETQIGYYLPRACQVKLNIYNVLGQKIRTLFDGHQGIGMQTLLWDGRDEVGVELSSGIYFYRLQADDFHQTKKMTLVK